MVSPENEYAERKKLYEQEEARYRKICRLFTWMRLIAFIGIVVNVYLALSSASAVPGAIMSAVFLVLLVFFVLRNAHFNRKRDYYSTLVQLTDKEIRILQFDFYDFPGGTQYLEMNHAYASDLDMFGAGSAYQYLNRTVTHMGQHQFVDILLNPELNPETIKSRQQACRELSGKTDWRLEFRAKGHEKGVNGSPDSLFDWLGQAALFGVKPVILSIIKVYQFLMLVLLVLVLAGVLRYPWLVLAGLINLGIVGSYLGRITKISRILGKTGDFLSSYDGLFKKIKEESFNSGWMKERIAQLFKDDNSAEKEIGKLRKLLHSFDSRNNLLIGFTRNALFLTDLLLVLKMEAWRLRNAGQVKNWLYILGEIDVMNSLATYSFNNPEYVFPEPAEGVFCYESVDLGHPLIAPEERICNNFIQKDWHSIIVLTGANMAGKSTFLRTVGLNLVLAHTGAPVCAASFRFKPCQIITSIRTNDSLIKHESYFYAELKKLKTIIDALQSGQEVFILLDEVLKGTNSIDKLNGSIILLKKLLGFSTSGIIATHDIALGELEKEFPGNILNRSFEADISEGELIFDYKLREGAATNMTALFLMKQMGIV
ncbi:MAG: hypothetical protein IPH88_03920 [Bacteroidales bacterium]|nr:hypothetical protein [Bacteroidales bacterium]